MSSYRRRTGQWTDVLRAAWAALGRRPRLRRLNRAGHRVYAQWERIRYGTVLTADVRSLYAYLRAERRAAGGPPVRVRLRELGGASMELRPGTTDAVSLRDTFRDRVHIPPPEVTTRGVRQIVDLGANIGATIAHNAVLYPEARILGVELDPGTAALAARNVAPWADRCQIIQGAVSPHDGTAHYLREGQREDGYRVVDASSSEPGTMTTRALSVATILGRLPAGARVDFLKMDIEGVEASLLSGEGAAWADRVDAIALQVHYPYTVEACIRDLEARGFTARVDPRRPNCVVGVRP